MSVMVIRRRYAIALKSMVTWYERPLAFGAMRFSTLHNCMKLLELHILGAISLEIVIRVFL